MFKERPAIEGVTRISVQGVPTGPWVPHEIPPGPRQPGRGCRMKWYPGPANRAVGVTRNFIRAPATRPQKSHGVLPRPRQPDRGRHTKLPRGPANRAAGVTPATCPASVTMDASCRAGARSLRVRVDVVCGGVRRSGFREGGEGGAAWRAGQWSRRGGGRTSAARWSVAEDPYG